MPNIANVIIMRHLDRMLQQSIAGVFKIVFQTAGFMILKSIDCIPYNKCKILILPVISFNQISIDKCFLTSHSLPLLPFLFSMGDWGGFKKHLSLGIPEPLANLSIWNSPFRIMKEQGRKRMVCDQDNFYSFHLN